ncbi:MAG: DUF6954 family protein [Saccharofermentanales bacterium]
MNQDQKAPDAGQGILKGRSNPWHYVIGIIISIVAGALIGFFGVIVSVFADSKLTEQLVTIAVILLIYFVSSGVCSFLLPDYAWKWGIPFGAPGILLLAIYTALEWNPYYLIYMGLIAGCAFIGAWTGSVIRKSAR